MHRTCHGKIFAGLLLALLVIGVASAYGKASIVIFTGKIQEIRQATALGLGKHGKFMVIKLDNRPSYEFRLSADDAVHYGLIDASTPSQVVTPKHNKGLGWNVKVTCNNEPTGPVDAPIYQVKDLERVD